MDKDKGKTPLSDDEVSLLVQLGYAVDRETPEGECLEPEAFQAMLREEGQEAQVCHLCSCPACRSELVRLGTRLAGSEESLEISVPAIRAAVRARREESPRSWWRWLPVWTRQPAITCAFAAALVLVVGIPAFFQSSSRISSSRVSGGDANPVVQTLRGTDEHPVYDGTADTVLLLEDRPVDFKIQLTTSEGPLLKAFVVTTLAEGGHSVVLDEPLNQTRAVLKARIPEARSLFTAVGETRRFAVILAESGETEFTRARVEELIAALAPPADGQETCYNDKSTGYLIYWMTKTYTLKSAE